LTVNDVTEGAFLYLDLYIF